jgi:3-isopropylmalate/(R)-2-methylmalate dehydratase large subunit
VATVACDIATVGATATEKILARASGLPSVKAGESVQATPDRIMVYDFPGFVDVLIHQLEDEFGIHQLTTPDRYVVFIDHLVTNGTAEESDLHRVTREWAARTGANLIDNEGIGHHVAAELGYALPGTFVVHFDAHVAGLGAFGTLGIGVHRQILEPWVTETIGLTVPGTVRIDLTGALAPHVDARDLLHTLIWRHGADGFLNHVVEFGGPGASSLGLGERQAVGGMIMFTGAMSALFEADDLVRTYIRSVSDAPISEAVSDADATYVDRIAVDLSTIEPLVVRPGSTNGAHTDSVTAVAGTQVSKGYIGSCASGRIEDIRAAAGLLAGHRVHPSFALTVVPTSNRIRHQAEREGLIEILERAGATVAGSSCDQCFGYARPLAEGEVCISTGTLNVRGRMGSPRSDIYMASAETVAASAIAGRIADPRQL